MSNEVVHN